MQHPYREGYSVLPRLKRISPAEVFQVTQPELRLFRELKQHALTQQICHVEQNCPVELKETVLQYLLTNYPYPLNSTHSLQQLSLTIAEDFVIHSLDEVNDWMALGCVYLPSGWRPEQHIGKSFDEIHEIIPGINLSNSRKLLLACIEQGPFERFVWGPVFSDCLNLHPDFPRAEFDPGHPQLYIKVERQVLFGFPEHKALLFLLKQSLIPESEIDRSALHQALAAMTPDQLRYKGLERCVTDVLKYLA